MKRNTITLQVIIMLALFLIPALLHAEPGFSDDVDDVPLDGGLSLLLAAGIGYACTKVVPKKSRVSNSN